LSLLSSKISSKSFLAGPEVTLPFLVYALDRELDLEEGSTKEDLLIEIEKYMIDWAELVGKYSKK